MALVQESHHSGTQGTPLGHQSQTLFTGTGKDRPPRGPIMGWVCAWLLLTQPQCLALSFVCETKVPSSCSGLCQVSHPFSLECSSGPGCPSKALAHSAPVYSHLNIFKPECYLWQLQMYLFPLVSPLLEQVGVPRQDLHSFLIMLGPRPAPVTALRKTWKIMGEEIGRKQLAVSSPAQTG